MPDLRMITLAGTGVSKDGSGRRLELSDTYRAGGGYWYRGAEAIPFPGEPHPREIVARLHAEIAAKSPEHAALVAAFEAIDPGLPAWDPCEDPPARGVPAGGRDERLRAYMILRAAGSDIGEAAGQLGISRRTAGRYEDCRIAAQGGAS